MVSLTSICPTSLVLVPPNYRRPVAKLLARLHDMGCLATAIEGYDLLDRLSEGANDLDALVDGISDHELQAAATSQLAA